jgi:hypothetical protein
MKRYPLWLEPFELCGETFGELGPATKPTGQPKGYRIREPALPGPIRG